MVYKMLVLMHVVVALLSIIWSTYLFFFPSKAKLYISYGLVGLTLGSGTILVLSTHAKLLQACLLGLGYTLLVSSAIALAQVKLANAENG